MTEAQTEARAIATTIAGIVINNDEAAIVEAHAEGLISTALAAKDAELMSAKAKRDLMAREWCDFCEAMGVTVDTQEAVAAVLQARADRLEALSRTGAVKVNTQGLIQALSRLAGGRYADGTLSLVSAEDRETIISVCHDLIVASKALSALEPAAQMTGEDVRRIFKPLPEEELAVLREADPDTWGHPATPPESDLPYICDACVNGDGGTCRCYPAPEDQQEADAFEAWSMGAGSSYERERLDAAREGWMACAALSRPTEQAVTEAMPRLTEKMMRAACQAHFGSDNIDGIDITAQDINWSFRDAFKRMWSGARKAAMEAGR